MRSHILHFILVATVVLSACAGAAAGAPGIPFRRETGMPDEPPAVFIGDGHRRVAGTRYTADWVTRRRTIVQSASIPVRWPTATRSFEPRDRIVVAFATRIAPDHVVVNAYGRVDSRGEPSLESSTTFECDTGSSPCALLNVDDETRLEVPSSTSAPYVVVFAIWHVPLDDLADGGPTNASASWIFRLATDARGQGSTS